MVSVHLWDAEFWLNQKTNKKNQPSWPLRPQKKKSQTVLREVGVAPPWWCHALILLAPNSWISGLSYEVLLVSVLALVLSESWKKLAILSWFDRIWHFKPGWEAEQNRNQNESVHFTEVSIDACKNEGLNIKCPHLKNVQMPFLWPNSVFLVA